MTTQQIDYNELESELIAVQAGIRAAESHGFLCGHYCASHSVEPNKWQDHLLGGIEDAADLEDCLHALTQLAVQVAEEIEDEQMSLSLLLPDDNTSVEERSVALAQWCGGFISGLGIGGVQENASNNPACDEFIKDVISISRMDPSVEDSEDTETDLMEIIEYIRVGVLMLHQEWLALASYDERPEILH